MIIYTYVKQSTLIRTVLVVIQLTNASQTILKFAKITTVCNTNKQFNGCYFHYIDVIMTTTTRAVQAISKPVARHYAAPNLKWEDVYKRQL